MSLEKILQKIKAQAELEAEKILKEYDVKAKEVEAKTFAQYEQMEADFKKQAAALDNEVKNATILPARLKIRGEELALKNALIDSAFRKAMELDDLEYKKVLAYFFSEIPKGMSGVLFPAKEREGLVREFVKENGLDVQIGEPVETISGGFFFQSGKIQYDCSFDTLLKKLRERLEPKVARLFDKED